MSCHFDLKCLEDHDDKQIRKLRLSVMIALFFMLLELIGGIAANSLALISDALHMFTDVGAFILSLIVLNIAKRPSTPNMTFGYQRAEVLGALGSALSLWALCFVLIYEACLRLIHPRDVSGGIVFIIAFFGFLSNLAMMKILHSHDHEEHLNVKAAYLHVFGDLLGSIGVIASGIIIYFTNWNIIDPLISFCFALMILFTSGKILRKTIRILMEAAPKHISWEAVRNDLLQISGVKEVHDLHIWSISTKQIALSAHLIAKKGLLSKVQALIYDKYKIHHMTIQIDEEGEFDPKYCFDT